MTESSIDPEYRVIEFERSDEAAGFIAALARQLSSPQAARGPDSGGAVEVFSRSGPDHVEVFLSGSAFAAAQRAFSPIPDSRAVSRNEIPVDRTLIIDGMNPVAMGIDDVAPRLQPE
ncbi:MAG TPA: hypothetical protein VIF83_09420 [Gemmatimonadaceae bacterium]